MRSQQVHTAITQIPNRFALCGTLSRATRKLHVSQSRTEDTMNSVLEGIGEGRYKSSLVEADPFEPKI